jgi:PTS system mannose-specific IID component
VLWRVFLRSLLLQASWNFERMQNLGVLFVLAPALRRLYRGEARAEAFRRHLGNFNTHPYLASPIFGASLALEEQQARGEAGALGSDECRNMLMAPFAAIGDALFWGGLRPLAAGIALLFAVRGSLWAPVVFLLCFNLPHLWLRGVGLVWGYRLGISVVESLQRFRLSDLAVRCKEVTVVLLGALAAYLVFRGFRQEGLAGGWAFPLLPVLALAVFWVRQRWSILLLILSVAGGFLLLAGMLAPDPGMFAPDP